MADVVPCIPADTECIPIYRRKTTYPWKQWMDGRSWRLTREKDFQVTVEGFGQHCARRAKMAGLELVFRRWQLDPNVVYFRFYRKSHGETTETETDEEFGDENGTEA